MTAKQAHQKQRRAEYLAETKGNVISWEEAIARLRAKLGSNGPKKATAK